ncbi:MAG: FHA domain-containing protein [Methylococcaceae bacterium]
MTHRKITIGRALDCDLVLADISVSRLHAVLELLTNNRLLLTDCQSTQGTFVIRGGTEERVQAQIVSKHDMIRFGNIKIPVSEILMATHFAENAIAAEAVQPAKNINVPESNHTNKKPDANKESKKIYISNRPLSNSNSVHCYINVEDKHEYPKVNPPPAPSSGGTISEGLVFILAVFLILTNPNKTDFGVFVDTQLNQKLSQQMNPGDDSLRRVRSLLSGIASKFVVDSTERQNYYLFSTYTLDVSLINSFNPEIPKMLKFIGIANKFFPFETQKPIDVP